MAKNYIYKDLNRRSKLLLGLLWCCIFAWSAAVVTDLFQLRVFCNIKNLEYTAEEALERALVIAEALQIPACILQIIFGVIMAVVFCCWLYRACANLWAWQIPAVSQKPMWCLWNYFIPIWSLFKPHSYLRELYNAPRWKEFAEPTQWKSLSAPRVLNWYWGFFLIGRCLDRAVQQFTRQDDDNIYRLIKINLLETSSGIVGLLTVILLYILVRRIDLRHKEYAAKLELETAEI